ncbi:ATPase P [Tissierella sp.]|jgi:soluble P-type ATPase|uniref:HAD family hydrolase n=1 Tax=Tissierella sp. TaxID=41274 RepID=UPI0030DC3C98
MNLLIYEIPGRDNIQIENIVFDYNGTIAVDGKLVIGVKELINKLAEYAKIYILTADTYGTVEKECMGINGKVLTFPKENAGRSKKDIVKDLGGHMTACLGNGFNDVLMFEESALSIAIIEREGTSGKLLSKADIVARSALEGLEILLNKNMIKATLRN